MRTRRPVRFFYPTRFHIFDQLVCDAFAGDGVEIHSVYPSLHVRRTRYARLAALNHTLWLSLLLRIVMRAWDRLAGGGRMGQLLRRAYVAGSGLEFTLRTWFAAPRIIVASAGYLGPNVGLLRSRGHLVIVNHGSLYEPFVRDQLMRRVAKGDPGDGSNWSDAWLVARMDREFADADAIVVCSPTARDTFPEHLHDKVCVVPLGAELAHTGASADPPAAGRGCTYLHVSNLSFGKNVAAVVRAFRIAGQPQDRLVIGGPAPRDAELIRLRREGDARITWLGQLDRAGVADAMRRADVFVHPSHADGWAMVVTEALAAGLPVVASRMTGAASYYAAQPGGEASIMLADPEDPEDIARCMSNLRDAARSRPVSAVRLLSWADSAEILSGVISTLDAGAEVGH